MALRQLVPISLASILLMPTAFSQTLPPASIADDTLEELMNIQVTSVSKRGQRLGKTAASVYVITAEDIRRSGLSILPEMLRLAPGVQVARSSSGSWAVSIRGFNDDSANKLLVLVDGRSVYSELASGVNWDTLAIPAADIERIEVIRGPGAAIWGTNAVNGVINIITKSAQDTQGGLITAEGGSAPEFNASARYGGRIGSNAYYRVGIQDIDAAAFTSTDGQKPANGWNNARVNFRVDWNATSGDSILFSGNVYRSEVGHEYPTQPAGEPLPALLEAPTTAIAGSMLARWEHKFSDGSDAALQFSWERSHNSDVETPLSYDILSLDLQQHAAAGERQQLTWGFDFHESLYRFEETPLSATPFLYTSQRLPNVNNALFAVFGQDQITLVQDKIELVVGAQLSHGGFSGFQIEPTARLLWTPTANLSTWAAVSRAVRTPSIYERSFDGIVEAIPVQPPLFAFLHLVGDPTFRSETMLAYEAGQRVQLGRRLSFDASAYYNVYQHLSSVTTGAPGFIPGAGQLPPYLEIPAVFGNSRHGESSGGELSATYIANNRWRVVGGYSMVLTHTRSYPGIFSNDTLPEGGSPEYEYQLHSYFDLSSKVQLDGGIFYYGSMPDLGVPRHLRGDVRLGWRPTEKWEFSAGVQDAFAPNHVEYISSRFDQLVEVPRNAYGKVIWRF
jgi:iron complex outermembrane receptor protein